MKTIGWFGILAFILLGTTFGQVPENFNYQAVIRNSEGVALANQSVNIKLSLVDELQGNAVLFTESHLLTSNSAGIINLSIGAGTSQTGTIGAVPWGSGSIAIKTEVSLNGGTTWSDLGQEKLVSVPYALYAGAVKEVNADIANNPEEPIFVVRNSQGFIVFAVYEEGVRVYVNDTPVKATSSKTGFAVGGQRSQKAGDELNYLMVYPDSTRINFRDGFQKASSSKTGFAIGGIRTTKAGGFSKLLNITSDSTQIFTSGENGGFSVSNSSGTGNNNYLNLTPINCFVGQQAGYSNTLGDYNIFLGNRSGYYNTEGYSNTFIGNDAGYYNTTGANNIFVGDMAGYYNTEGYNNLFIGQNAGLYNETGNYNVYLGNTAGENTTTGSNNTFIGDRTGNQNTEGSSNIFIGDDCGYSNLTGEFNIFLGGSAGWDNTTGNYNNFIGDASGISNVDGMNNVFMGDNSGYSNVGGSSNVFLGASSGSYNESGSANVCIGDLAGSGFVTGSNNVMLGNESGYFTEGSGNVFLGYQTGYNEIGSNKLYIDNSSTAYPLLLGDFESNYLDVNGEFYVNGTAGGFYSWNNFSDARLKTNIITIDNALSKVNQLHGIYFNWLDTEKFRPGRQIGLVAQEVKEVIPEVVSENKGTYMLDYSSLSALLIEAIKEQTQTIENMKADIEMLKSEVAALKK